MRDKSEHRRVRKTVAEFRNGCHCWGSSEASVAGLPVAAEVGCRWVRATRPMQMDPFIVMRPALVRWLTFL